MPDNDFADKVVVITGASKGIGAAFAHEIANRGARVVLVSRQQEPLSQLARRLPGEHLVVAADVTDRRQVDSIVPAAVSRFGRVDVWVNNAGRGITRAVEELSDEDVDTMMRDNLKSALYGMQAVLPHFKDRGQGVLVNVSSMLGRVPLAPFRSAYSAAKAALNSLTESLRADLQQKYPGICVSLVLPGIVATEFGLNALGGGPDSRALPGAQTVEQVAKVIADGIRDRKKDIYTRTDGFKQVMDYLHGLA